MRYFFLSAAGVLLGFAALGQAGVPSPSAVRGSEYPRIHPDGKVSFQVKAPTARTVQVAGRGADTGFGDKVYDMVRSEEGVWTVTTDPIRPGFHYYQLLIDGVPVNDPSVETFFGWGQPTSGLEIPDPELDFYEAKDVPHGEVRIRYYHSKVTGKLRRVYVYLPPREDLRLRLPVLYLQHGAGESERAWTAQGRANFIMDNLIVEEKAQPMIVVMDNGYARRAGASGGRGNEDFPAVVVEDLIPLIDDNYPTLRSREHRAIAGLSMGGYQALATGLGNLKEFAWIGAFSGGLRNLDIKTSYDGVFRRPEELNKWLQLLWLGYGAGDRSYEAGKAAHEALWSAGVLHTWHEEPGTHEWQVWRKHLHAFAQLLFKKRRKPKRGAGDPVAPLGW